jgi:hypothetical protein
MVLGDPPTLQSRAETFLATLARFINPKVAPPPAPPVVREKPWQLRND